MHHALGRRHHLAASLAVQHLLELWVVLAASQGVALAEVYASTVREVPLAPAAVVRVCQRASRWLAIIILDHATTGVNLLEGDQIRLGKLHLTTLVVSLVGLPTTLTLAHWHSLHLPITLNIVGIHAELANVRRIRIEIQSCSANCICNDSIIFSLGRYTTRKYRITVGHLLLTHLSIITGLLDPVVSRGAEVNQTLLVLLNELVVRHRHFQSVFMLVDIYLLEDLKYKIDK